MALAGVRRDMWPVLLGISLSPVVTFDPWFDVPSADGFDFPVGPPDAEDYRLPTGELVQTQYGHLDRIDVTQGDRVARGDPIGTVGNAHGIYCAHLHFEVRTEPGHEVGGGYGEPGKVYLDPIGFIRAHRPG